jgi:hypothetical protein
MLEDEGVYRSLAAVRPTEEGGLRGWLAQPALLPVERHRELLPASLSRIRRPAAARRHR